MLGRKVVEGEQRLAILDQAFDRLVVFDAPSFDEGVECCERINLGLSHPDFLERAVLCTQQRWPRVFGHTSSIACQKPSAPSV
jgi:hypothetical protein